MFVSRVGDILSCDNGVYEVIHQFVYDGQEYVMLSTLSASFEEVITKNAPMFLAREIVSDDGQNYYLDFLEDRALIVELINFLKNN